MLESSWNLSEARRQDLQRYARQHQLAYEQQNKRPFRVVLGYWLVRSGQAMLASDEPEAETPPTNRNAQLA